MRPIKASLLVLYCIAALAAVGTAVSHLWNTSKQMREAAILLASSPVNPSAQPASQPS